MRGIVKKAISLEKYLSGGVRHTSRNLRAVCEKNPTSPTSKYLNNNKNHITQFVTHFLNRTGSKLLNYLEKKFEYLYHLHLKKGLTYNEHSVHVYFTTQDMKQKLGNLFSK